MSAEIMEIMRNFDKQYSNAESEAFNYMVSIYDVDHENVIMEEGVQVLEDINGILIEYGIDQISSETLELVDEMGSLGGYRYEIRSV